MKGRSSEMDLKTRKSAVFAALKKQMKAIHFQEAEIKALKNSTTITFLDKTRVLLQLSTVTDTFETSEFGAYLPLLIYEGPIFKILTETGLAHSNAFPSEMIVRYNLAPRRGLGYYEFRAG